MTENPENVVYERCLGVVVDEVLRSLQLTGPVDSESFQTLRAVLANSGLCGLDVPLVHVGVSSLTWMSLLSTLEDRLAITLPDEVVVASDACTVGGLARAVASCLRRVAAPTR